MRCPKCQYISFDQTDRCRNCGYEFVLTTEPAELDLPIRSDEPLGPLADFSFETEAAPVVRDDESIAERAARRSSRAARAATQTPPDLPLFGEEPADDDAPLVSVPAAPRAPISVRKSSGALGRPHADEEPAPRTRRSPAVPVVNRAPAGRPDEDADGDLESDTAAAGSRVLGAVIDLLLLGSIDFLVLYLTLEISGLTLDDLALLPLPPFLAFLAMLNGGYFVTFTAAGGQTIGKMLAGTRVVSADETAWSDRVLLGQAVVRSASYLVSALPAGLGFLPGLVGPERRAVHDRIARTRVVKA